MFHFINNYINNKKIDVTVEYLSYGSSKTCIIRPSSPKLFMAEVRDKHVYDMVADDYGML